MRMRVSHRNSPCFNKLTSPMIDAHLLSSYHRMEFCAISHSAQLGISQPLQEKVVMQCNVSCFINPIFVRHFYHVSVTLEYLFLCHSSCCMILHRNLRSKVCTLAGDFSPLMSFGLYIKIFFLIFSDCQTIYFILCASCYFTNFLNDKGEATTFCY